MKNRFSITNTIVQKRYDEVIALGKIVKGPMQAEGYDHYHVQWLWKERVNGLETLDIIDLICDAPSKKYRYEKV